MMPGSKSEPFTLLDPHGMPLFDAMDTKEIIREPDFYGYPRRVQRGGGQYPAYQITECF